MILTEKGLVGEIKHPDSDEINKRQKEYINNFLNLVERNVYNGDISNIDLDSFKYSIVNFLNGKKRFLLCIWLIKEKNIYINIKDIF